MSRVVIVGRPNVGKSTLFNRLTGLRKAITENVPGVTRDAVEGEVKWTGKTFTLVDTGGFLDRPSGSIEQAVKDVVEREVKKADLILFVVDGKEGLTPLDEEIGRFLQRFKDRVLLVVNKADTTSVQEMVAEVYGLGFGEPFLISAGHGRGVGELLDAIVGRVGTEAIDGEREAIKIAFVGRPNTGKSTLINALLRDRRLIVSEVPGTTRDAVDVRFSHGDRDFILVDTAGVRRPSKVERGIEFYSVGRTIRALERSDVVCLVLDAGEPVSRQDKRIAGLIERRFKGAVLVVNKMDVSSVSPAQWKHILRKELPFLDYAPAVFTSGLRGEGLDNLLESVLSVYEDLTRRVSTSLLNRAIGEVLKERPPMSGKRQIKVFYAFQKGIKPPTFVVITNDPEGWKESYMRFFARRLRERLGLEHSPIRIVLSGRAH